MTSIYSEEEVSDRYLSNLREELTIFMNRSKVQIEEDHLEELGESFLEEINQRFTNENEIIRYIAVKWSNYEIMQMILLISGQASKKSRSHRLMR